MKLSKRMEFIGYALLIIGAFSTIGGGIILSKNTDKVNSDRIIDLRNDIDRKDKELGEKTKELGEKTEFIKELNKKIDINVGTIGGIVSEMSDLTREIESSSSFLRNEVEQKKLEWNLNEYSAQFEFKYNDDVASDTGKFLNYVRRQKKISFQIRFSQEVDNGQFCENYAAVQGEWIFEIDDIEIPLGPNIFSIGDRLLEYTINQATMNFDNQKGESFLKNKRLYFQIYGEPFFELSPNFGLYSNEKNYIIWAVITGNEYDRYYGYFERIN